MRKSSSPTVHFKCTLCVRSEDDNFSMLRARKQKAIKQQWHVPYFTKSAHNMSLGGDNRTQRYGIIAPVFHSFFSFQHFWSTPSKFRSGNLRGAFIRAGTFFWWNTAGQKFQSIRNIVIPTLINDHLRRLCLKISQEDAENPTIFSPSWQIITGMCKTRISGRCTPYNCQVASIPQGCNVPRLSQILHIVSSSKSGTNTRSSNQCILHGALLLG